MSPIMHEKLYILMTYALIGMFISLYPLILKLTDFRAKSLWRVKQVSSYFTIIILLTSTVFSTWVTGEYKNVTLLLSLGVTSILIAYIAKSFNISSCLGIFIALCISTTLAWWKRDSGSLVISNLELLLFCLVAFIVNFISLKSSLIKPENKPTLWFCVYLLIAITLSFSTGILADNNSLLTLWHHWGAYIGPAELLLSGASIFHDFPAQYGLGPTSAIAAFCANDCWTGTYYIASISILSFAISIGVMAFTLTKKHWTSYLVVTVLVVLTCYFWVAYPPGLSSPVTTPSVSGLRFLPATLLTLYLFYAKNIESSNYKSILAHSIWAVGALWSPESAFYVTLIWWPYYLFIQIKSSEFLAPIKKITFNLSILIGVGLTLIIAFNAVYFQIYHELPTFYGYLAYAIDPPGPMPISPHGAIWFFIVVTLIGMQTLNYTWKHYGDSVEFRRSLILMLLNYGAFSYFLGRSHDNNILNLTPFMLLILLNALAYSDNYTKLISRVLSSTLIAWICVFGWKAWVENINNNTLFNFQPTLWRKAISYQNPESQLKIISRISGGNIVENDFPAGLPSDASKAINYIENQMGEPVTVLDFTMDMVGSSKRNVWNAIHGPANYGFIPSERKREFLIKTAKKLNKSGWLVIDKKFPANEWLSDFDFVYNRIDSIDFGTYYAIHYAPRAVNK